MKYIINNFKKLNLLYYFYLFFKLKIRFILFLCDECLACIFVYLPSICMVNAEVRRGCQTLSKRNHGWLWSTIWELRTKPEFSARTASARS